MIEDLHNTTSRNEIDGKARLKELLLKKLQSENKTTPLAPNQLALWYLYAKNSDNYFFNLAFTVRIHSELDVVLLKKAIQKVVNRHEELRATFHMDDNDIRKVIHGYKEVFFEVVSTSKMDMAAIKELVVNRHQESFNLEETGIKAHLFVKSPADNILLINVHHILIDGLSYQILLREIQEVYQSLLNNQSVELPSINAAYENYASAQNQLHQSEKGREMLQYWKELLSEKLTPLSLKTDSPRPPVLRDHGASLEFVIPSSLGQKLQNLARENEVTFYVLLLAVYQILLHKLTGQDHVLVGSPATARPDMKYARTVGNFVNPITLVGVFTGDITFKEHLIHVKRNVLSAIRNQDYPFSWLVKSLEQDQITAHPAIFQAMFALGFTKSDDELNDLFENSKLGKRSKWGNFEVEKFDVVNEEGQYDVSMRIVKSHDALYGRMKYNTDLFHETTIQKYINYYLNLLHATVENREAKISSLSVLSKAMRNEVLYEFNKPLIEQTPFSSVSQWIEAQCAVTPENIAIVMDGHNLSYDQLNKRSNQIAHGLQQKGARPDQLIGVMMDRTPDAITAIMGILKSGAAYLPLDPDFPHQRLEYMMEDSRVELLLTDRSIDGELSTTAEVLNPSDFEDYPIHSPEHTPQLSDLAYVIYTSGSTGMPKGVMIEHGNLIDYVSTFNNLIGVSEQDVVLQQSTLSFDISIEELFPIFTMGGKLVITNDNKDVHSLLDDVNDYGVTMISTTPAMVGLINQNTDRLGHLRLIISGGDVLKYSDLNNIIKKVKVYNGYGPTETTVSATYFTEEFTPNQPISIGKPLQNRLVYILDEYKQPVPPGISGELHIGGPGVSRGYLNQQDLTDEKFVPDPFNPDSKMYKTGDLASWYPDGQIEFLGRIDHQVKIRGYRIELEEISNTLLKHPGITSAIVTDKKDQENIAFLVAYFCADHTCDPKTLSDYLHNFLPDYMVPTYYIGLEVLPVNTNGKIDLRALPEPEQKHLVKRTAYVTPQNELESSLTKIWESVLKVQGIGTEDSFFELGGHSLKAGLLISEIRNQLKVDLSLRNIFKAPTIKQLAVLISGLDKVDHYPIPQAPRQELYPIAHQHKFMLRANEEEGSKSFNMPSCFVLEGDLDEEVFIRAIQSFYQRHEALRTAFVKIDGQNYQIVSESSNLSISTYDFSGMAHPDNEARIKIEQEHDHEFDLSSPPLFRASLMKLDSNKWVALLNVHHIVFDGWSHAVMLEEIRVLYSALLNHEAPKLPEMRIQHKDCSVWQNQIMDSQVAADQQTYWAGQMSKELKKVLVKTDFPRHENGHFPGDLIKTTLPDSAYHNITQYCRSHQTTPFIILLAVYKAQLYLYSGQEEINVGTEVVNRYHKDLENQLGFYLNLLVLRDEVNEDDTFASLLQRVDHTTTSAFENQITPYDVVQQLYWNNFENTGPLFNVMASMHNYERAKLNFEGVRATVMEGEKDTSFFDLHFHFIEGEGQIKFYIQYNSSLFTKSTIESIQEDYLELLTMVFEDSNRPLTSIQLSHSRKSLD